MRGWRRTLLTLVLLSSAATAHAQTTNASVPPGDRGYISAGAGLVVFPTMRPLVTFEFAEQVRPRAQAYASFSYYDDVLPDALSEDLDAVSALLTTRTGTRWNLRGRDRVLAFAFGGRYVAPRGFLRPYVGAGGGFMRITRTITDPRAGAVARAVLNDFGVGSADLVNAPNGVTRALLEFNGGVHAVRGRLLVDLGYRYRTTVGLDTRLELSEFGASIGYRF